MAELDELKCPNCGSIIPRTSRSCAYCGTQLLLSSDRSRFVLAVMFCPHCGFHNVCGAQYCEDCTSPLYKECSSCHGRIEISSVYCTKCGESCEKSSEEQLELQLENLEANRSHIIAHGINPLRSKLARAKGRRKYYIPTVAVTLGVVFLSLMSGTSASDWGKILCVLSTVLLAWIGIDLLKITPRMKKKLVELDDKIRSLDRQISDYSDELRKDKGQYV
jgi:predicted RNA-binding Zn-ribbon protein involved in translation (DUF1610 family)